MKGRDVMLKRIVTVVLTCVLLIIVSFNSITAEAPLIDNNMMSHENVSIDLASLDASVVNDDAQEKSSRIQPRAFNYDIQLPDFTEETLEPGTKFSPVATMYHSINEVPFTSLTNLFVRPSEFEDHLKKIDELGYEYIFADQFDKYDVETVMLTFDDGYEDNYTEMFPLLKKYNAKATIFMITSEIDQPGYLTSKQIREMADSGLVRFASHTHDHFSLTSLSADAVRDQFETSKDILTKLTGREVRAVCYPGGSITEEIAQIASEYFDFGYTTVNSSYTFDCDPLQIPRVRISRGMSGNGLAYLIG